MPIHAAHRTQYVLCPQNTQFAIYQGSGDLAKSLTQLFCADCRGHDARSPSTAIAL